MHAIGTIEKLAEMETETQAVLSAAGFHTWQIPGKPVAVRLNLDVVDNLLPEVMRAFGAVPKRGAEVGGLLIGSIEHSQGGEPIVRVETVEIVPCVYARGPSYLLTNEDQAAFEQALERWTSEPSKPLRAVGYFRSHTREGLSLAPEDIELMDRQFPDSAHVALLIRPFATKPVQGGFFVRESGLLPAEASFSFVFSRRELGGESLIPRASEVPRSDSQAAKAVPPETHQAEQQPYQGSPVPVIPLPDSVSEDPPAPGREVPAVDPVGTPVSQRARLPGWVWIPLSFAFLLMGAVAGLMAPKYVHLAALAGDADEFSLGLAVSQDGDNLTVRWNGAAAAIRSARSGVLEIEDHGYSKPVDLDSASLQAGSLIYRNTSPSVRFRLTVREGARSSVTETTNWPQ
jgi:hypothetical protein